MIFWFKESSIQNNRLKLKKAHEKAQLQRPTSPLTLSASPPTYPPMHEHPPLESSRSPVELRRRRLRCVLLYLLLCVPTATPAYYAAVGRSWPPPPVPDLRPQPLLASAAATTT
jgi:hypothetical protein